MAKYEGSTLVADQDSTAAVKKAYRRVMGASTLSGDNVVNKAGEDVGKIDEIMIDTPTGRVAYAVLSFGGFLGMGDKLFAIPWSRLSRLMKAAKSSFWMWIAQLLRKRRASTKTTGRIWPIERGVMEFTLITARALTGRHSVWRAALAGRAPQSR